MVEDPLRRRMTRLERETLRRIRARERAALLGLASAYRQAALDLDAVAMGAFREFGAPATWSLTDFAAPQRTAWLLDEIVTRSEALAAETGEALQLALLQSYQDGYYLRGWTLGQVLPLGAKALTLPMLPAEAVLAALTFPYEGSTFFQRMGDAREDFIRKVRRSITVSQVEGEGMRQAQKRLARDLGWPVRKRENKGLYARAEMITRTEMLRASNLGAAAVDEANRDILSAWEWKTARDERVCPICGPLDTKTWPIGRGQRPPIHPRCRCTSLPVRKSDAELGLPEVPSEFPPRQTYRDWAAQKGHPLPLLPKVRLPAERIPVPRVGAFTTVKEAQAWASSQYSHITWNFKGLHIDAVNPTLKQFDILAKEWPMVAQKLTYVGRLSIRGELGKKFANAYAYASHDGKRLGLSPKWYSRPKELLESIKTTQALNWLAVDGGKIEGLLSHEFGHLVNFWLISPEASKIAISPYVQRSGLGWLGDTFGAWERRQRYTSNLSRYAVANDWEGFAEAFMALQHNPLAVKYLPEVQRLQAILEVAKPRQWRLAGTWKETWRLGAEERAKAMIVLQKLADTLGIAGIA